MDEAMVREGAAKLAALHQAQRKAVAKVVPIATGQGRVKSASGGGSGDSKA